MSLALTLTWAGVLTGCYAYQPLGTLEPAVGSSVAAELNDAGSDTLARAVGPYVVQVRGSVTGVHDGSMTLAVSSVADRAGRVTSWAGEEVVVPDFAVRSLAQKKLSPGRTALMGIAVVAGSLILWDAFQGIIAGGSRQGGGGGGEPE